MFDSSSRGPQVEKDRARPANNNRTAAALVLTGFFLFSSLPTVEPFASSLFIWAAFVEYSEITSKVE